MTDSARRTALLALYRPNVGRGTAHDDPEARAANATVWRAIVALGLDDDGGVARAFRERDFFDRLIPPTRWPPRADDTRELHTGSNLARR